MYVHIVYFFVSPLGGKSGRQQHLPQAPSLQRQAVRRGNVRVPRHRLQRQRGAAPPRPRLPPGGAWEEPGVGRRQAAGAGAAVTWEPPAPPPPSRGQGTEEEISRQQQHWLWWKLRALEWAACLSVCMLMTYLERGTVINTHPSPQSWGVRRCWTPQFVHLSLLLLLKGHGVIDRTYDCVLLVAGLFVSVLFFFFFCICVNVTTENFTLFICILSRRDSMGGEHPEPLVTVHRVRIIMEITENNSLIQTQIISCVLPNTCQKL